MTSDHNLVRSRGNSRAEQFTSQDLPFGLEKEGGDLKTMSSFSSFSSLDSECSLHLTEEAMRLSYERSKTWFLQYVLQDKASRKVISNYNIHTYTATLLTTHLSGVDALFEGNALRRELDVLVGGGEIQEDL